jgi:hypothetical protein
MVGNRITLHADPDPTFRFDAVPDPTFHFDADPDLNSHFYEDPETDFAPHQSDACSIIDHMSTEYRPFTAQFLAPKPLRASTVLPGSILSLHSGSSFGFKK